ncbi:polyprenyl synthetase family protein [Streptomyces sp. NPDC003011]
MRESLDAAEKCLADCLRDAPAPAVAALLGRLVAADTARLRSLLVLLGAEFGASWRDGITQAAVTTELLHLSLTLSAARPSAVPPAGRAGPADGGCPDAVAAADWLLARSAQLSAGLGPGALRLNARTAGRLAAGQLRELAGPVPGEDPVAHYVEVTAGTAAAPFAMALGIGALQADAPRRYVRALTDCGEHLGAALTIADDLLAAWTPATAHTRYAGGPFGHRRPGSAESGRPSVRPARPGLTPRGARLRGLLTAGALREAPGTGGPVGEAPGTGGPVGTAGTAGRTGTVDVAGRTGAVDAADRTGAVDAAGAQGQAGARRQVLALMRTAPAVRQVTEAMQLRLDHARAAVGVLPSLPARRAIYALCDLVAERIC